MAQRRMIHLSLSLPLADEASAAMAAYQIEQVVQRELGEPETFVGGFHVVFPNESIPLLPSPVSMVKDMVNELRDAGVLPKQEPWEKDNDDEEGT